MKHPLFWTITLLFCATVAQAQTNVPERADPSMFRPGYDIPAGVTHGTWDFDEWPGVDHNVVYKQGYMYNSFPNEKIKIDYFLSLFDKDDHEGYLKTPEELKKHGFTDFETVFGKKPGTLLGIFSHPDDELLLAGGLLARAAQKGWKVEVYLVSNGADGSKGQTDVPSTVAGGGFNSFGVMDNGNIAVKTDVMGENKLDIVRGYAEELGVQIHVLQVDFTVQGRRITQIGEAPGLNFQKSFGEGSAARTAIQKALKELVASVKPTIILTHGTDGEYGNYVHKTVHELTVALVKESDITPKPLLFTCFPEYNFHDKITHFIDLQADNGSALTKKWEAIKKVTFLYEPGKDFDKPWDPNDKLMDGVFVKDYGYAPTTAEPPRYEFFTLVP